jgi:hypothetical protein
VSTNVIEKQKHLLWCRKNNFAYQLFYVVLRLWSWKKFNNAENYTLQSGNTVLPARELDNKVASI